MKTEFSFRRARAAVYAAAFLLSLATVSAAQTVNMPVNKMPPGVPAQSRVMRIDSAGLKKVLAPAGRPLLVNFWATWCDPCREEFPDLVRIDNEYKGRVDVITVSLDELSEINRQVPKFLADMNAEMPAYLLKTADEGEAIAMVAKNWKGGLPFTVIYNSDGSIAYFRQGKIRIETVRDEINKLFPAAPADK
jgi:thiol-disulfide isomerase/thioredoxin